MPAFTRKGAAEYLRNTHGIPRVAATLAKEACYGTGPKYARFGRKVVYYQEHLDEWAKAKLTAPSAFAREHARAKAKLTASTAYAREHARAARKKAKA